MSDPNKLAAIADDLRKVAKDCSNASHTLQQQAQQLDGSAQDLTIGTSKWAGKGSQSFLSAWNDYHRDTSRSSRELDQTAQALNKLAQTIEDNLQALYNAQAQEAAGWILTGGLVILDIAQLGLDPVSDAATVGAGGADMELIQEAQAANEAIVEMDAQVSGELDEITSQIENSSEPGDVNVTDGGTNDSGNTDTGGGSSGGNGGGGRTATGGGDNNGPGEWENVNESMSERASQYQSQITGRPPGSVYRVNGVKFDGYQDGTLIDAKGPGYANFLKPNGTFQPWWSGSRGLVDQARSQIAAANGTPIKWYVAEPEAADAINALLRSNRCGSIEVIYMPPNPLREVYHDRELYNRSTMGIEERVSRSVCRTNTPYAYMFGPV